MLYELFSVDNKVNVTSLNYSSLVNGLFEFDVVYSYFI